MPGDTRRERDNARRRTIQYVEPFVRVERRRFGWMRARSRGLVRIASKGKESRLKVLIAEDSLTSRTVLEIMLKKLHYEIVSTRDGNEAWAALQAEDVPKLAILDWMMPGMDGVEICRKVRSQEKSDRKYIILLTALDQKKDIVMGLDAGADDYMTKPFDIEELHARIQVGQRILQLQEELAERVKELEKALSHVKTLQGLLPICMHCHKIRSDQDSWQKLEGYIESHTEAEFSHSLCPSCLEKYYPNDQSEENGATDAGAGSD